MIVAYITTLIHRDRFGHWLNDAGLTGIGLEIGTYRGEFAETLLNHWCGSCLHTCDPYQHSSDYVDGCMLDFSDGLKPIDMEALYAEAKSRLARFEQRVQIHRMDGLDKLKDFGDGDLDFVYCDGNHGYDVVIEEFHRAWPKLRHGGVLATHDTYSRHDHLQHCGAWEAVWDFAHEIGQRPHLTCCTSSWFVKP